MSIQVHRDKQSLFDELMSWISAPGLDPPVRIEEWVEDDRRVIRADIPGVDPRKDITLSVDGGLLQLRGERRVEEHDGHRTEMRYGSFARAIAIPPGTQAKDISASYADGVLTVSMPATGAQGPETIPVAVGTQGADEK